MTNLPQSGGHGGQTRGMTAGAMPGMGAAGIGTSGGAMPGAGVGKFDRMFPQPQRAPNLPGPVLLELAQLMTGTGAAAPVPTKIDDGKPLQSIPAGPGGVPEAINSFDTGDENPLIPAGYTYFGQFIDHDITFDPTPLHGKQVDTSALQDFRTPALDLDSVYGTGPDNQPYLYHSLAGVGPLLRVGGSLHAPGAGAHATVARNDHFRLPPDDPANPKLSCPAILGDKRNDENKIVAQIHTTFIALHNKLMHHDADLLRMGSFDTDDNEARTWMAIKTARWHYQWVVLHDYVARICEPGMVAEVLNPGATPRLSHYLGNNPDFGYIPIEFAVAAFRLGHSMVRPTYALNTLAGGNGSFGNKRIPIFKPGGAVDTQLNGFGEVIRSEWGIDWSFFLDGLAAPKAVTPRLAIPQPSYRIDATIVDPLSNLPEFMGSPAPQGNLAYRNLLRSQMDQLPSGEDVADRLNIARISFEDLWWAGSGSRAVPVDPDRDDLAKLRSDFGANHAALLTGATPLWYYILREAEIFGATHAIPGKNPGDPDRRDPFGGQHLGPVGSRIVAETFVGLLWMDKTSFIHAQPGWRPFLGLHAPLAGAAKYQLADLFRYALS